MNRFHFFIIPFVMDASVAMAMLMVNLYALDLGADTVELGYIGTAWGLFFALGSWRAGWVASRFRQDAVLYSGTILYAVAVALNGYAASPATLMLIAPLGGLASGLFWPSFETLLHSPDAAETQKRMGRFNVGWTLGIMIGTAAAGYLYQGAGARWAFWIAAAFVLTNVFWLSRRTDLYHSPGPAHIDSPGPEIAPVKPSEQRLSLARRTGYLKMAWIANFMIYLAAGSVSTIFPKFARTMGIDDQAIGVLSSFIMLAQAATFAILSQTGRWHYRLSPMLVLQGVSMFGFIAIAWSRFAAIFALAFLLLGISRGLSYAASLYYGLDGEAARGVNTGNHEAIIGVAFVLGPLMAGFTADLAGIRAPFVISAAIVLIGIAWQLFLWRHLPGMKTMEPACPEPIETGSTW